MGAFSRRKSPMPPRRFHFSYLRLATQGCPIGKAQVIYWDATTPGLGLRITQKQIKSYVFEIRFKGKTVRTTLGRFKDLQVEEAQAEAVRLRSLVEQGIDPRGQSQRATNPVNSEKWPVQLSLW